MKLLETVQQQVLAEKLKLMVEEVKKKDGFIVIHHYDCDGITAAAIISTALERIGKKVVCKAVKQLYKDNIEEIKGLGKYYIFADFGSGQVDYLMENFYENFFVLDHHQPINCPYKWDLNACYFGIDGGKEISGAGMAYLFAKTLDKKNVDLARLAVIGACGDMQDLSDGKLVGINQKIIAEAEKEGYLKKEIDLRLYGRFSRPLTQFLMFSTSPIIPELTGNEQECIRFLERLGIELRSKEKWKCYGDLSDKEKQKLTSALLVHLSSYNVPEWKLKSLIGEVYTMIKESADSPLRDAKESSTLANACGRHLMADIAVAVFKGDRGENYEIAMAMMQEHRRQLREGIELMTKEGVQERKSYYFFDAGNRIKDSLVGIVAGMMYGGKLIETNKPILAMAQNEDGSYKISARGSQELQYRGINLGKALKEVCKELGEGNEGGGHVLAAGCKIEKENKKKFLELIEEKLERQMKVKSKVG